MKHFKFLSLMLMAIVAMFAFTACGDDDDKDNKGGQQGGGGDTSITADKLIGTWYGVDENSSKKISVFVMDFTANGQGHYAELKAKADENWEPREPEWANMTWTLSNGTLNATVSVPNKGDITRKGDIISLNGNKMTVRRYLDDGYTDEIVMTRVNSADEFALIFAQMILEKTGGGQGEETNTSELAGNWTAVAFTPEGGSRFEINRKNENHWQWCLRFVLTDNEITQYAINYQGSEGYRGREEKTLIGKYRVEGNTFIIYDYYEGYHNVKDQEESGSGIMSTEPLQTTFSLSNSIFTLTIAGYGVYELQKTDGGEQGGEEQGGGQGEEQGEASLLGTWKTIRIAGNATEISTGEVLESWNNYPTLEDAQDPNKESLKYMEYTFNKDGSLKVQSFDESSRQFNIIMEGTWIQNGDIVIVTLMLDEKNSFSKTFDIVELTADKLTLHETHIDDEFKVHGRDGRYQVVYDENVYCTRK